MTLERTALFPWRPNRRDLVARSESDTGTSGRGKSKKPLTERVAAWLAGVLSGRGLTPAYAVTYATVASRRVAR